MNIIKKQNLIKQISIIKKLIKLFQILLIKTKLKKKDFQAFAYALRERESGGNYKAINPYGYIGAYQFGMARLCDLNITERKLGTTNYKNKNFDWKPGYSKEYFLNNPNFQNRIFKEHAIDLIKQIKFNFSEYINKEINEEKVSLSGFVAFCHLAGVNGLNKFLKGLGEKQDAYGTKGSDYLKEFNGYDLTNI